MLTHIDHPEDLMLKYGTFGFHVAVGQLQELTDILQGSDSYADLSMKVDGSPAIVFGNCPETGQYFVSTKRFWNKKSIRCYSVQDIVMHFAANDAVMGKLLLAFEYLRFLFDEDDPVVYQCDFLFDKNSLKDGTFKPCIIEYHAAEGAERHKMQCAHIGVAIHSQWKHDRWVPGGLVRKPGMPNHMYHETVYVLDTCIDSYETHTIQPFYLKAAQIEFNAAVMDHITGLEEWPVRYVNKCIREGTPIDIDEFVNFCPILIPNARKASLYHLFGAHQDMMHYKDELIAALDSEKHNPWLKQSIDGMLCGPEGYVMHHDNVITKLVNRRVYSHAILKHIRDRDAA
jgi:hypothetical protein